MAGSVDSMLRTGRGMGVGATARTGSGSRAVRSGMTDGAGSNEAGVGCWLTEGGGGGGREPHRPQAGERGPRAAHQADPHRTAARGGRLGEALALAIAQLPREGLEALGEAVLVLGVVQPGQDLFGHILAALRELRGVVGLREVQQLELAGIVISHGVGLLSFFPRVHWCAGARAAFAGARAPFAGATPRFLAGCRASRRSP